MPDLTEYDKAPVIDEKCEWCGEGEDNELGPVRKFNGGDEIMHSGCMYSYEHGALRTALNQKEGNMNDHKLSFVVSAGHAEYMVAPVENVDQGLVMSSIEDYTVEVLRGALTGDFSDIPGWEAAAMTGDTVVTIAGDDHDLNYETFVHWYGPRKFIEDNLEVLMKEVGAGPYGADDDTFDYWPSGVKYAQQVADQLSSVHRIRVDEAARKAIETRRPEFKDELFSACRLES